MIVKKLIKDSTYITTYYIIQKIANFIFFLLLARFLGQIGIGKFAFSLSFIFIFCIFANAGLDYLLIKDVARSKDKLEAYLSNIIFLRLVLSFLAFVVILATTFFIDLDEEKLKLVYILSIANLISINTGSFTSVLRAFQHMKTFAIINTIREILVLGPACYLIMAGYDLITVTYPFLIGNFVTIIIAFFVIKRFYNFSFSKIDLSFCKNMLRKSYPFALSSIAIAFFIRIDKVMLSMMKGDAAVGIYSIANSLVYGLLAIPFIYNIVLFPVMSKYFDQSHKLESIFEKSFKLFTILGVGIGIAGSFLAKDIIVTIYGPNFMESVSVLKYFIWISIFLFIRYTYMTLLEAIDKQLEITKLLFTMAFLNLAFNAILIPSLSYTGAILATFVTEIIGLIWGFKLLYRSFPTISIKPTLTKLILIIPAFLVFMLFLTNTTSLHSLFIKLPLCMIGYVLILIICKAFSPEELKILKKAFKTN